MNRFDFYFEQLVTQADMDEGFDFAELADQRLQSDNGYVGIAQALEVVEAFPTPNLTVDINAGVAYDQDGKRCAVTAPQNLDISIDSSAVSTAVAGGGNEKWLAIFIAFDRTLSDPRVDGNGVPLQYRRAEGFQFIVDQSAEAPAGTRAVYLAANSETYILANGMTLDLSIDGTTPQTVTFLTGDFGNIALATAAEVAAVIQSNTSGLTAVDNAGQVELTSASNGPGASLLATGGNTLAIFAFPTVLAVGAGGPARPALRPDAILLADVLLRQGTTAVQDKPDAGGIIGVIDMDTRRESVFEYDTNFNIRAGTIVEFADSLADILNSHIANTGNPHPASAIVWDNDSEQWTPGFSNPVVSTDVHAALHEIIDRLKDATSAAGSASGAEIIGLDVATITNTWADGTKPTSGSTNVAGTFAEVVGDLGGSGATDGAKKVGYDAANFSGRYGAAGALDVALDALADQAARRGAAENISAVWTFDTTLIADGQVNANGDIFVNSIAQFNGQHRYRGVELDGVTAPSFLEEIQVTLDRRFIEDGSHTLLAGSVSTANIPMLDFTGVGQDFVGMLDFKLVVWEDVPSGVAPLVSTFRGLIPISFDDSLTTFQGDAPEDVRNDTGAGVPNLTGVNFAVAGAVAGIDIAWALDATTPTHNYMLTWEVYRARMNQ